MSGPAWSVRKRNAIPAAQQSAATFTRSPRPRRPASSTPPPSTSIPATRATTVTTEAVASQRTSATSAYPATMPDRRGGDAREPARERREEEEREEHGRDEDRRVREGVVDAAPGDGEGDGAEGSHDRASLPWSAKLAAASATAPIASARPNPSASACPSQPVTIRLRSPSIRYETGLIVATMRNQSISIRFRGRFMDERKRKTKRSGNIACTASPVPVRSARTAPIAPKAMATRTARKTTTKRPATPLSGRTPAARPTVR